MKYLWIKHKVWKVIPSIPMCKWAQLASKWNDRRRAFVRLQSWMEKPTPKILPSVCNIYGEWRDECVASVRWSGENTFAYTFIDRSCIRCSAVRTQLSHSLSCSVYASWYVSHTHTHEQWPYIYIYRHIVPKPQIDSNLFVFIAIYEARGTTLEACLLDNLYRVLDCKNHLANEYYIINGWRFRWIDLYFGSFAFIRS